MWMVNPSTPLVDVAMSDSSDNTSKAIGTPLDGLIMTDFSGSRNRGLHKEVACTQPIGSMSLSRSNVIPDNTAGQGGNLHLSPSTSSTIPPGLELMNLLVHESFLATFWAVGWIVACPSTVAVPGRATQRMATRKPALVTPTHRRQGPMCG